MKTQNIQHVPVEEVQKALEALAEEHGAQNSAAKAIGDVPQVFNKAMRGFSKPTKRMLDHFKLEAKVVYVRAGK